jgi:hypothetical protein
MLTMPFGKHKDEPVRTPSTQYLLRLSRRRDLDGTILQRAVEDELAIRRTCARPARPANTPRRTPAQLAQEAAALVADTPAAQLFGEVTRLLFKAEMTFADTPDEPTRTDVYLIGHHLRLARTVLYCIALPAKRLQKAVAAREIHHVEASTQLAEEPVSNEIAVRVVGRARQRPAGLVGRRRWRAHGHAAAIRTA